MAIGIWNSNKQAVIDAAINAESRVEAVKAVSKILGKPVLWNSLDRQWGKWLKGGDDLEPLFSYFRVNKQASKERSDVGGELTANELESYNIKIPGRQEKIKGKPSTELQPIPGERWLVPGDIHFGIQDDVSIGLMVQCAEDFGVDRTILQGDTLDCYGISRHDHRADKIRGGCFSLEDEANEAYYFFNWMKKSKKTSYIMPGNHEDRIWAVEDKNLGLHGSLTMRGLFRIPREIQVLPQYSRIVAGSLIIEHGHKLPGSLSQYGSAKVLRDHPDQCTIFGHTHRMASARKTTYDRHGRPRTRMAMTIGHMSIAEKHIGYAPDANWQQGFALIEFWNDQHGKLRYTIYLVEIHDHEFCFQGKMYR